MDLRALQAFRVSENLVAPKGWQGGVVLPGNSSAKRPTDMYEVDGFGPARSRVTGPFRVLAADQGILISIPRRLKMAVKEVPIVRTKNEYADRMKESLSLDAHCSNRRQSLRRVQHK